jgi:Xaa-Pro aminopeptidase
MISHEVATLLNSKLSNLSSRLCFPPQNLIDPIWEYKPPRPKGPIVRRSENFTGEPPAFAFRVRRFDSD